MKPTSYDRTLANQRSSAPEAHYFFDRQWVPYIFNGIYSNGTAGICYKSVGASETEISRIKFENMYHYKTSYQKQKMMGKEINAFF